MDEQAGLEVVQPIKIESPPAPVEPELSGAAKTVVFTTTETKGQYLRGRLIFISAAIALLVIIATILGAVLGTRAKRHGSPLTPANTTISPSTIRKNSGLAVTGWRNASDFSIRLFYQGQDGFLRMNGFETASGNWASSPPFVQARDGTPLAASCFNASYFFNNGGDNVCNLCKYL
jgi:hypothetical protein